MEDSKVCRECGETKAFSEFRRNSNSPDGYAYHCKACSDRRKAEKNPRHRERLELRAQGLKRCSKCKEVKALESFTPDSSKGADADGRKCRCRDCSNGLSKQSRARRDVSHITEKCCTRCGETKPISEFTPQRYKETGHVYGYLSRCKPCASHVHCTDPRALAYRKQNMHKISARAARWQAANPERKRMHARMRIHRKRVQGGEKITLAQVQGILDAQKGKCFYCRKKLDEYHIDHFIPLAKGGKHALSNLVVACPNCNARKHAKDPLEFMMLGGDK